MANLRACAAGLLSLFLLSNAAHAQNKSQPSPYKAAAMLQVAAMFDPQAAQSDDDRPHTVEQWKAYIKAMYSRYFDFTKVENTQVFCKRYQDWKPVDLKTLKQYMPVDFQFFAESASPEHFSHKGHEVLEIFLPDYYKKQGGVEAFRRDILALRR